MKKTIALVLSLAMLVALCACGNEEKAVTKVAALKGPTSMGMVNLIDSADEDYEFSLYGAADEITAGLINGSIDIAALPCNLAATLYNNTEGKLKVAAVNTLGVLYILETGESITDINSLSGKTIYSTGKGTTPEFVLNYILEKNGVENVTVEYKSESAEVAALLSGGGDVVAMLPQPYVASVLLKNANVRIALDITQIWDETEDADLVTGVLVARSEYIENNGKEFEEFLKSYASSVDLANSDIDKTAALCVTHGIVASEEIAKSALPYCNIVCLKGSEMKNAVSLYLNVLYNASAASIGGKLPDDDFYYISE